MRLFDPSLVRIHKRIIENYNHRKHVTSFLLRLKNIFKWYQLINQFIAEEKADVKLFLNSIIPFKMKIFIITISPFKHDIYTYFLNMFWAHIIGNYNHGKRVTSFLLRLKNIFKWYPLICKSIYYLRKSLCEIISKFYYSFQNENIYNI